MGMNNSILEVLSTGGSEEKENFLRYDRYLSRTISPSYMESLQSCPAKTYMEKLTKSSYDAFLNVSSDAQGSAVHAAIDKGLSFLQVEKSIMWSKKTTGRSPTDAMIKIALQRARAKAELSLREHVPLGNPSIGRMRTFIDQTIEDYGKRYLSDLSGDKQRYYLASEMPVSTLGLKTSNQVGGILDAGLYDANERLMRIIDTKWVNKTGADHGHDYLSVMKPGILDDPSQATAAKVYMYSMLERHAQIDKIDFEYNIYWDVENGPQKGRQTVTGNSLTRKDMPALKAELADNVANVLAYERELSSTVARGRGNDVTRALAKVKRGACSPHACAACPFRYQCSFRNFVEEARYASRAIDGETFPDAELKKLTHLDDADFIKKSSAQHTEFINDKRRMVRGDRYKDLIRNFSYNPVAAHKVATEEAETIAKSYEDMRYMKRGLFEDKVVKGAVAARAKLPISILDPGAPASWMSVKLRRNMQNYATEHVDRLSKSFGVPVNLARDMVIDNVFRDRDLAYHLQSMLIGNTTKHLENMGVSLAKHGEYTPELAKDVGFALRQYETTIDRNFALTVQGALDDEFVRHVMTIDQDMLKQKPGVQKPPNIMGIINGTVDKKLIKTDPNTFLSQVAHSEAFGSVLEKTRLGAPRFPVGSVLIAGMLSYIAGVDSISRIVKAKQEKLSFYLSHQEDKVEDGSHASVYTTARRLMYSDFGSAARKVGKRSAVILRHLRNFRNFVKDAITVATGYEANRDISASRNLGRALGYGANRFVKSVKAADFIVKEPSLLIGGTAAGFALSGLLPHVKGNREMRDSTKERRERFKRLKKSTWNTSSPSITPESELRESYRAHTPIGSHVFKSIAVNIMTSIKTIDLTSLIGKGGKRSWASAYDKLKEFGLDAWSGLKQRAENVYTKSSLNQVVRGLDDEISYSGAARVLTRGEDIVKKAAQKVSQEVNKSRIPSLAQKHLSGMSDGLKGLGNEAGRKELRTTLGKVASEASDAFDELPVGRLSGLVPAGLTLKTPADSAISSAGARSSNLVTKTSKNRTPEDRGHVSPGYYQAYNNFGVKALPPQKSGRIGKKVLDTFSNYDHSSLKTVGIFDIHRSGTKSFEPGLLTAVGRPDTNRLPPPPRKVMNVMAYPSGIQRQKGGREYNKQWSENTDLNRLLMNGGTQNRYYSNGSVTLERIRRATEAYG